MRHLVREIWPAQKGLLLAIAGPVGREMLRDVSPGPQAAGAAIQKGDLESKPELGSYLAMTCKLWSSHFVATKSVTLQAARCHALHGLIALASGYGSAKPEHRNIPV